MSVCPQVFTALSSKLLISIYECAETRMRFCLRMELAPLGSILARWKSQGSCSECQVGLWFSQLVLCLCYLHSRAIVHRWVSTGGRGSCCGSWRSSPRQCGVHRVSVMVQGGQLSPSPALRVKGSLRDTLRPYLLPATLLPCVLSTQSSAPLGLSAPLLPKSSTPRSSPSPYLHRSPSWARYLLPRATGCPCLPLPSPGESPSLPRRESYLSPAGT